MTNRYSKFSQPKIEYFTLVPAEINEILCDKISIPEKISKLNITLSVPYIFGEILFVACAISTGKYCAYIGDSEINEYKIKDENRMDRMRVFFNAVSVNSTQIILQKQGKKILKNEILDILYKYHQEKNPQQLLDFSDELTQGFEKNASITSNINSYIGNILGKPNDSKKIIFSIRNNPSETERNINPQKLKLFLEASINRAFTEVILLGDKLPKECLNLLEQHKTSKYIYNYKNISCYDMTNYSQKCNDIAGLWQLQAQAYVVKRLRDKFNTKIAVGTHSGGTHMLALFGIPTLYLIPSKHKDDDRMQRIGYADPRKANSRNPYSTFFPMGFYHFEDRESRGVSFQEDNYIEWICDAIKEAENLLTNRNCLIETKEDSNWTTVGKSCK